MSSLKTRLEARRRSLAISSPLAAPPVVLSRRALRSPSATRVDASEPGVIRISGAPFIAHPTGPTARRFFERAFGSSAVESVSIDAFPLDTGAE